MIRQPLPIDAVLPQVVDSLRASNALVLVAPPGAGKTTRVPPAMLAAGLLNGEHNRLVMLQPRRVAARAAAARIAVENGWVLGQQVGYQVRFERVMTDATRLRVLTEGILTRQLIDDPFLDGIGAVVLDEFHERGIHTDLAIALLREIQQTVRPDLKLIVMSATLAAEPVAQFLGGCPIIRAEGRVFPVDVSHDPPPPGQRRSVLCAHVAAVVAHELDHGEGDVLVFLPGAEEIRRTTEDLEHAARQRDVLVLPLHGSLPFEQQVRAIEPANRRRVILATNIAETSLTIEGVRIVVDSGLARIAAFDPQRGMDRLELRRISRASATQRAGRAGRTAPGRCIRLWSAAEDRNLIEFEPPEMLRVDLAPTILSLHAWGIADPRRFDWFAAPPEHAIASAERLLAMLGALSAETDGRITDLGRKLLAMPVHPRLARLLLAAGEQGLLREGAAIAALLSEKDILIADRPEGFRASHPRVKSSSDLLLRLDLLADAERGNFARHLLDHGIDVSAARHAARTRDQLLRIAGHGRNPKSETRIANQVRTPQSAGPRSAHESPSSAGIRGRSSAQAAIRNPQSAIGNLLALALLAYPDRVARRRGGDGRTAVMVGGAGVRLAPESSVTDAELFLALDARQDERNTAREAVVRIASAIDAQWLAELFPGSVRRVSEAVYDEKTDRVTGMTRLYYRDLLLREDREATVDAGVAGRVLADKLRPRAGEIFAADEKCAQLIARVALLRQHMPEHPWPAFDVDQLGQILAESAEGRRSLDEIRRGGLLNLLRACLAYPLDRLLEEHAPEAVTVPSGSRIRIEYVIGRPPALAVRLQEIFGWMDTPAVAAGRCPLVLQLLSPSFRPVQVTSDLKSFWANAYFQVRKDLRVRYPRHSWPDNPLTARPEAKGGRRRG